MLLALLAFAAALLLLAVQYVTTAVAGYRCRRVPVPVMSPDRLPPISVVRPLCGRESHTQETLEACFRLDYPGYEILFCVADAADPVVSYVQHAMAEHPETASRLLVGDDKISANPKLNNMWKGWQGARHDRIAFIDSNVLVPADFLRHLVAAWRDDTGVVSAPPIGVSPVGFWSHLECAFLNTHEARWQYTADTFGMGFAQGKTMLFRRVALEPVGFAALAAEPAEDAATTKIVRRLGLRARLAAPSPQPLGRRTAREVWSRQVRWARLRRATFPLEFVPELLCGAVLPSLAAGLGACGMNWPVGWVLPCYLLAWFAPELGLAWLCRWPLNGLTPFALVLRDLLIPALWVSAWTGSSFTWRGTDMRAATSLAGAGVADL